MKLVANGLLKFTPKLRQTSSALVPLLTCSLLDELSNLISVYKEPLGWNMTLNPSVWQSAECHSSKCLSAESNSGVVYLSVVAPYIYGLVKNWCLPLSISVVRRILKSYTFYECNCHSKKFYCFAENGNKFQQEVLFLS